MLKQIIAVIKKDLSLEWRNLYAITGILVQLLTSIFIVYISVPVMNIFVQNSFFWLILIFVSINAITKGFLSIDNRLVMYYKQLIQTKVVIRAQLVYNIVLMMSITLVAWLFYNFLIDGFNGNNFLYLVTVMLTGVGFSAAFTLMSALARYINNSFLIAPVISLPIIIPMFILGLNSSRKALDGLDFSVITKEWLLLLCLSVFSIVMTEILFLVLEKK